MNFGLSGDTTEGMTKRFYRDVLRAEPTICIIMGGVNDLFGGIPSRDVMEALSALYGRQREAPDGARGSDRAAHRLR